MNERLPEVMTAEEWDAFIRQFGGRAPTAVRNAAMFTLMREAGLRTCEVLGLKTDDIRKDQLDGRPITVLTLKATKGGKQRNVYLNLEADRLLQSWLAKRTGMGLGRFKHLFVTLKGQPLDAGYVRTVCARKGVQAGITWRVHPHALRHTFATDLLEKTGDLALVQDALGHSRPETTRIYAKVRNSRLARAMAGHDTPDAVDPDLLDLAKSLQSLSPQQRQALTSLLGKLGPPDTSAGKE